MKFYYPAVIKHEDGRFHAVFPDLAMCEAFGDDLEDVLDNAIEAAFAWIDSELHEDDPDLPPASDPEDLALADGEMVRNILVNYRIMEGWEE